MNDLDKSADGRVRQPVPTSGMLLNFDLADEIRRLNSEQPWQAEHTANTIIKYSDFRIVLIALKTGARLHEHRTSGCISIQCLSGEVHIQVEEQEIEVSAGKLVSLDSEVPHAVEAKLDSVLLLTIALRK